MLYVGWDIGIKNLAYCIIETNKIDDIINQKIVELDIINLILDEKKDIILCSKFNKNGKKCSSRAVYRHKKNQNDVFCNRHYKQFDNVKLLSKIKIKKTNANKVSLEILGKKLFIELDKNPLFIKCDNIIIENQPVLKNPKMKSIQIMLYSYFLIKNKNINDIQLINASNKLKVYKGKLEIEVQTTLDEIKDKYKKNKMTAIEHCRTMIKNQNESEFLEQYNSHKKKDDLADAYLMCQYFINKH